jgi:hypothetical protein
MDHDHDTDVDIKDVMDRVGRGEPLDEYDRQAILAGLMLWTLVPEHTRTELLQGYLMEVMCADLVPTSTAIN